MNVRSTHAMYRLGTLLFRSHTQAPVRKKVSRAAEVTDTPQRCRLWFFIAGIDVHCHFLLQNAR